MRLNITHDRFTKEQVREVIQLVRPPGISKFDIEVKNSQHAYRGRAYTKGCSMHGRFCPLVIVAIGGASKYPHQTTGYAGYLSFIAYSEEELLVEVMAHELRHLWQRKHPRGWRVWGSRGKYSERDADAYGIRMLRAWRQVHQPTVEWREEILMGSRCATSPTI